MMETPYEPFVMQTAPETVSDYKSSLEDLKFNSKPLINMLTILAEEGIAYAPAIVQTVDMRLDEVEPEEKLPILYLVDSIIKNVSRDYVALFSQVIVKMFTNVFKQVDERTRSQMFKLRETWHDVFPPVKLYQLDVKVNLIDPAWPIQAQLPQSSNNTSSQKNIHLNPLFIKPQPVGPNIPDPVPTQAVSKEDAEFILRKKQEELRLLQLKRKQIEEQHKSLSMSKGMQAPQIPPSTVPTGRIAPAGAGLVNQARRRDPRLARQQANVQPTPLQISHSSVLPHVATVVNQTTSSDKLDKLPKHSKNHEEPKTRRDPRLNKKSESSSTSKNSKSPHKSSSKGRTERRNESSKSKSDKSLKVKRGDDSSSSPSKRKKDSTPTKSNVKKVKRGDDSKSESSKESPDKQTSKFKHPNNIVNVEDDKEELKSSDVTFKELKSSMKDRHYRNREKSQSPDDDDSSQAISEAKIVKPKTDANNLTTTDTVVNGSLSNKDVDLRQIPIATNKKRKSDDGLESSGKKSKVDKFDALFGNEDVDLRTLNSVVPSIIVPVITEGVHIDLTTDSINVDGGWAKVKGVNPSPVRDNFKAKHTDHGINETDRLGRPFLYKSISAENKHKKKSRNFEDTDMRLKSVGELDDEGLDDSIKTIMSQASEGLNSGQMNKEQYNTLISQVLSLNERQKLKAAKKRESIETHKRRKYPNASGEPSFSDEDYSSSPKSDMDLESSPYTNDGRASPYGDIDERIPTRSVASTKKAPLLPKPDHLDTDFRMNSHANPDNQYYGGSGDQRYGHSGRGHRPYNQRGWRGRSKGDDWNNSRYQKPRGQFAQGNWRGPGIKSFENQRFQNPDEGPRQGFFQTANCTPPYVRESSPPPLGGSSSRDFPFPDQQLVELIQQDHMKSISIDGIPREIRYYDTTSIIMMAFDDPRDISFNPGQRRIFIDGESYVLRFGEDYVNIMVDGIPHRAKFGGPTRELIIDNQWFECGFGGPMLEIMLDGRIRELRMEGPIPKVSISEHKRRDLVVGKINLIIDGTNIQPIFLDAKPQVFEVDGHVNTIRFADSLQTILINEKPFKVEFGALPKPIFIGKRKHFIRFSVLPPSVVPGQVNISNMEGIKPAVSYPDNIYKKNLDGSTNPDNENSQSVFGGLDMLASVMPSSLAPASQFGGYSVGQSYQNANPESDAVSLPHLPSNVTSVLQNINVNDLFDKLVSSGIVKPMSEAGSSSLQIVIPDSKTKESRSSSRHSEKPLTKNVANSIKPVNLLKPETLRISQPGLVSALYSGMQCGSCGVRFPPEHTVRYSQHLDWHYRQNKAEKDSQRRPHSRRWYYDITDWIQYEEIEDLEEREKSWFETQQQAAETESSEATAARLVQQQQEASSVPTGQSPEDLRCELCRDNFEQFYHEESEEWHLRKAVRYEDKNYHPLCLEEYKASLVETKEEEEEEEETSPETTDNSIHLDETLKEEKPIEPQPVEIVNLENTIDENTNDKDNESIVEVLSECQSEVASQEDDNEDDIADVEVVEEDDDVVLKENPVEEIVVDDADTDDETEKAREERDKEFDLSKIDFSKVKIKQEPVDPEDEPIITSTEVITTQADTTHTTVLSSIDGNVQLEPTTHMALTIPSGGIRINIAKPMNQVAKDKEAQNNPEPCISPNEPPPPGDEPEIDFSLKPTLQSVSLTKQPIVKRGSELSGLCSIM